MAAPVHYTASALVLLLALGAATPHPVNAQVEVETDPLAWALDGFSVHVAGVFDRYRLSVGAFGIDVPRALHGNDGWSATMRGAGIKADLLRRGRDGFFVGADANYYRMAYALDEADLHVTRNEFSAGLRAGYRLRIGQSGLYIVPWVGVGYNFGDGDVVIGEDIFEHKALVVFPTVHVGWRF